MDEKIYIKEKNNNIIKYILLIVIVSILSSLFTYILIKGTNKNEDRSTNVTYEIKEVDNPVIAIAKKTGPSIVGIKVKSMKQNIFGTLSDSGSEGSGIIYTEDGYIITNHHVIESAINNSSAVITVTFPDQEEGLEATIVGSDKVTDLAVLKVEKTGLTKAEIGISKDVVTGELAVAIGNPLGQEFAGSVTSGIISAINRKITTEGRTFNLLQTDAAINPGNSGGALVNSKGQVIGINTIKIGQTGVEGLGFAIPIDEAKPIVDELISNKKIARPYIGISGLNVDKRVASAYKLVEGIYVEEVTKNSPASKAGIISGDIIIKIDSKEVKTMEELNLYKNEKKIGDTITLKVNRQNKEIDLKVTLEEDVQ